MVYNNDAYFVLSLSATGYERVQNGRLSHRLSGSDLVGTRCPRCESWHDVKLKDLFALAAKGEFNLNTSEILCPECTAKANGTFDVWA